MHFTIHFGFSEQQITYFVQGLIFIVAAVVVLRSMWKAKRTNQVVHLKWLVPLAIYTVDEATTYGIDNICSVLNLDEPGLLNTITDITDDVSLLAFLWALIVLWKSIRSTPDLLKTPWLNATETPEGVWPPAPKA